MKRSVVIAVGLAVVLSAPASAAPGTFTWSGGGSIVNDGWSNASNWAGHAAPSGSVTALAFPSLRRHACTAQPPTQTCYSTLNDLTGLTAGGISIDDLSSYFIGGNPITIGPGGITATASPASCPCGNPVLILPIALGAPQTWSVDGGNRFGQLAVASNVSGAPNALRLSFTNMGMMNLQGDIEAGAITVSAPALELNEGVLLTARRGTAGLNSADRDPVKVSHTWLTASHAAVGPLSLNHGVLDGAPGAAPGTLAVHGTLTFNSTSELLEYVSHGGSTPGRDYWQLSVGGTVRLGGGHLVMSPSNRNAFGPNQPCPKIGRGTTETLIKTTGKVVGRFAGIPNGGTASLACDNFRKKLRFKIRYQAHRVIAVAK